MKRYSAPPSAPCPDPSRPPNDDESEASLSDGSKKVKTAQSFESLFNSESLSDIVVDVNGGQYVFHAHKMIVGLKSERLAALINTVVSATLDNNNSSGGNNITGGGGGGGGGCGGPGDNNVITSFSESTTAGGFNSNNNIINNNTGGCNSSNNRYNNTQNNKNNNNNNNSASDRGGDSAVGSVTKPILFLQESPECGAVFSRFLYFIYSGAVWLHRDYVMALFQLALKYGVAALAAHCENYVIQLLRKGLNPAHANNASSHAHSNPAGPASSSSSTPSLSVCAVCDLCEEEGYREETRRAAFALLARRFAELSRTERWASCRWTTVRELLRSDECPCEENLVLVAATDWMKRNRLQDRTQIQEILASIRYPRLPRRVLYHLHTTASFKNFPLVQELIEAAIRYHCFKEVPEAQADFTGRQYHARGGGSSRHSVHGEGRERQIELSGEGRERQDVHGEGRERQGLPGGGGRERQVLLGEGRDLLVSDDTAPLSASHQRPAPLPIHHTADVEVIEFESDTLPVRRGLCLEPGLAGEEGRGGADSPEPMQSSQEIMEDHREAPPPFRPCRAHHTHHHAHTHHRPQPRHHHRHAHISSALPDCPLSSFHPLGPSPCSTGSPVAAVSPRVQTVRCQAGESRDMAGPGGAGVTTSASPDISLQINIRSHTQV